MAHVWWNSCAGTTMGLRDMLWYVVDFVHCYAIWEHIYISNNLYEQGHVNTAKLSMQVPVNLC